MGALQSPGNRPGVMRLLLERVLDLLAGVLEARLRLVAATLVLGRPVTGRPSQGFLGLAAEVFDLVLRFVGAAHGAHSFVGNPALETRGRTSEVPIAALGRNPHTYAGDAANIHAGSGILRRGGNFSVALLTSQARVRPWVDGFRRGATVVGAAVTCTFALLAGPAPASAQPPPCPDVEVVFARGATEPPGVGMVGQAFVDALRPQVGSRSLGVYPVNYAATLPASDDFADRLAFAKTFVDGLRDEGAHVESMAANCPNTRQVLGGYSEGAALTGFVTSPVIPKEVPAQYVSSIPKPMPPEIANHVAAVVLFGKPSDQWMRENGALPIVIGPLYKPKTIELCAPDDNICNGAPEVQPTVAHVMYAVNGMTGQGADFAASHL